MSGISHNGTNSVTFSGTVAQINALLNTSTGTVVYNDNATSPGTSTTLALMIHDNGNNGGSDLSGTASSTIDIASGNFGSLDWRYEIDPFAATQGTSTTWIVPNSDGLTSTVFNGGGFTYDPTSHLPTAGGISSIELVDNLDQTVLQKITGVAVSLGDFGSFIARAESIRSQIGWSGLVEGNKDSISFSSTEIRLANADGTFTQIIGDNFAQSGALPTGNVTSVEQLDAQGHVLHTVNLDISLGDLAAAVFLDGASQQFYDLATLGNTNLTQKQVQVGNTQVFYSYIDDSPGNHNFFAQAPNGNGIDFQDATSGVTVNLGTVVAGNLVSGQGTASWGGYNDTLTNIEGAHGSKSADTLVGDNEFELARRRRRPQRQPRHADRRRRCRQFCVPEGIWRGHDHGFRSG